MHSRRLLGFPRFYLSSLLLSLFLLSAGCGTSVLPGGDNASPARPDQGPGAAGSVNESPSGNSVFEEAQPAPMAAFGEMLIAGTIDGINDVDIYDLGPAAPGDRVAIDVVGQDGLNTVAALFDQAGDLIDANDDRSYYAGKIDPYLSRVIREASEHLYLGIAVSRGTHFASGSGRYDQGSYTVSVRREPGAAIVPARQQVVYLNFEGGDHVQIGLEPVEVMRPFSAESISGRFAGQTNYIINLLLEHMRVDYAAIDVVFYDSKHHPVPSGEYTKLYFGNYNAAYLGLADNVDTGNAYLAQEAIIYAEDLALFETLWPSAEETAQALANIASHELGHLLGLEHTAEAQDLMSTAASARQVLEVDASFLRVQLQAAVFPLGWQNNPYLLLQNVGANPQAQASARLRLTDTPPKAETSWRNALPDIPIVQCSRCAHDHAGH